MRIRLIWIVSMCLGVQAALGQQVFQEAAFQSGIGHSYGTGPSGGGVSLCDFTNDGWDDLTVASEAGDSIYFYRNNRGIFTRIRPGLAGGTEETKQVLWVDYDNDGDKDLFVTAYNAPNRLYQNDGNLHLTDVTLAAGLPIENLPSYGACWGDYDRDGWLDVYVTDRRVVFAEQGMNSNHLYRNKGDGSFEEKTLFAGAADSAKAPFCASFVDINNDNWPDIYIAQDKSQINTLLKNMGDGTFEDISISAGANLVMNAMCVAFGDYDGNGFLDLYVSNTPHGNKLLRNNGDETFTEVADSVGVGFYSTGWASTFLDIDNDADLDLYVSGMVPGPEPHLSSALYENEGNGQFSVMPQSMPGDTVASFGHGAGDVNADGYPDIFVSNTAPYASHLWRNIGGANHYIRLQLEGTISNRDGIGAWIAVYANGQKQIRFTHCGIGFLGQNSSWYSIGLGTATIVDSIVVTWPSGEIDRLGNIAADQAIRIIENSSPVLNVSLETPLESAWEVFPNPAKESFQIVWSMPPQHPGQIVLREVSGKRVWQESIKKKNQTSQIFEIGKVTPGYYLLEINIPAANVRSFQPFMIR